MVHTILKLALVGVLLIAVASGAAADSLFESVSTPPPAQPHDGFVMRERHVRVDLQALRDQRDLRLNLFGDASYLAIHDRVEHRSADGYTWFGTLEGHPRSIVVLTVQDGILAGHVRLPGAAFQILAAADELHAIRQINTSMFAPEGPPLEVPDSATSREVAGSIAVDSGEVIDVMVVYTPAAAAAGPGIEAQIQLAIDLANQSYINSGIQQRLQLVLTREVQYVESGDGSTDLNRLQNPGDGFMDDVHPWREEYCADAVQMWNNGFQDCGRAFVLTDEGAVFEEYAFSIVWRDCNDNYTPAHEFGHNMGGRHDRFSVPDPGAFEYSHGYIHAVIGGWRTIMAVIFGDRIPHFSNPDVLYQGVPTGVPEGDPDSADNRKTLNNTATLVANFRDSTACALEVPRQTVTMARSGTNVTLAWGATCGTADDYTIYEGDLGPLRSSGTFSHESVACSDIGADLTETLTPAVGNRYYLVVPRSTAGLEGAYGFSRPVGSDVLACGITGQRPGTCP